MRRRLLWSLVLLGVVTSVPALRSRVSARLEPVRLYLAREVGPSLRRGLNPVYRWVAVREMRVIAHELRLRGLAHHPLPHPRDFTQFLERQRYIPRGGVDPWRNAYLLVVTRDSIIISSWGADGERGTEDDLRHAISRR